MAAAVNPPQVLLLMGVSGSGKTTIGLLLARTLGWRFTDADDFHPPANRAKMAAGQPLTDADRVPWLAALRAHIDTRLAAGEPAVIACSALRQSHRDALLSDPARVQLIHLHGTRALLRERLAQRTGHFMPPALLDSQLATLETPAGALAIDIALPPAQIVASICRACALHPAR